jgi:hypothetical protein
MDWALIWIALIAVLFVSTSFGFIIPASDSGRLARKLCLINAVGWLLLLPLPTRGHPPLILIGVVLFWLMHLILIPAGIVALWVSHRDGEERLRYLIVADTYVLLNLVILFVAPLVWLLTNIGNS